MGPFAVTVKLMPAMAVPAHGNVNQNYDGLTTHDNIGGQHVEVSQTLDQGNRCGTHPRASVTQPKHYGDQCHAEGSALMDQGHHYTGRDRQSHTESQPSIGFVGKSLNFTRTHTHVLGGRLKDFATQLLVKDFFLGCI